MSWGFKEVFLWGEFFWEVFWDGSWGLGLSSAVIGMPFFFFFGYFVCDFFSIFFTNNRVLPAMIHKEQDCIIRI